MRVLVNRNTSSARRLYLYQRRMNKGMATEEGKPPRRTQKAVPTTRGMPPPMVPVLIIEGVKDGVPRLMVEAQESCPVPTGNATLSLTTLRQQL